MNVDPKPSPRVAGYVRKIVCDEWECLGRRGSHQGVLRHITSGVTVTYATHDGGNDWNGPRNFASAIQRVCGCKLIEPRGRKRSRKRANTPDPQVQAARRKYAAAFAAAQVAQETLRARAVAAAAGMRVLETKLTEAADRRRREIEEELLR